MRRRHSRGLMQYLAIRPHARRSVALAVIVFFCFQSSRFYLSAQMTPVPCPHHHPAPVMGAGIHSHHMAAAPSPTQEGSFYFQCCKETYNGIGLTPAQPLGLPVHLARIQPEATRAVLLPERSFLVENFLPPPFQPPRANI